MTPGAHDQMVVTMMFGIIAAGSGLCVVAFGLGMIWRSWGFWNL